MRQLRQVRHGGVLALLVAAWIPLGGCGSGAEVEGPESARGADRVDPSVLVETTRIALSLAEEDLPTKSEVADADLPAFMNIALGTDPERARAAWLILARSGSATARNLLVQHVQEGPDEHRAAALWAISRAFDDVGPVGAELWVSALTDGRPARVAGDLRVLCGARQFPRPVLTALCTAVESAPDAVVEAALAVLYRSGTSPPECQQVVVSRLEDPREQTRVGAAMVAAAHGFESRRSIGILLDAMTAAVGRGEPWSPLALLEVFGRASRHAPIELSSQLRGRAAAEQALVVAAIATLGSEGREHAALLLSLGSATNEELREGVVRALGAIGADDTESRLFVERALADVSGRVRAAALLSGASLFDISALGGVLRAGSVDADDRVREEAIAAAEVAARRSLPLVVALARAAEDARVRVSALHAISRLGASAVDSVSPLLEFAADPDPTVATAASVALWNVAGSPRARGARTLEALCVALNSAQAATSEAAAAALERWGPRGAAVVAAWRARDPKALDAARRAALTPE